MTVAAPVRPASTKQRDLIKKLLTERVLAEGVLEAMTDLVEREDLPLGKASELIGQLMKMPKLPRVAPARPAPVAPAGRAWDEVEAALVALPDACKFAIQVDDFTDPVVVGVAAPQPMAFFETRTYRGKKYFKKLLGAPGSFSRVALTPAAQIACIRAISVDPIAASLLFGKTYTCCGKCGADLTDEVSRRTGFGPTCRALLGIEV